MLPHKDKEHHSKTRRPGDLGGKEAIEREGNATGSKQPLYKTRNIEREEAKEMEVNVMDNEQSQQINKGGEGEEQEAEAVR